MMNLAFCIPFVMSVTVTLVISEYFELSVLKVLYNVFVLFILMSQVSVTSILPSAFICARKSKLFNFKYPAFD